MNLIFMCLSTILINTSYEQWNRHDFDVLKTARQRCAIHYPKSPCVKRFIKVAYHTYNVICGK